MKYCKPGISGSPVERLAALLREAARGEAQWSWDTMAAWLVAHDVSILAAPSRIPITTQTMDAITPKQGAFNKLLCHQCGERLTTLGYCVQCAALGRSIEQKKQSK